MKDNLNPTQRLPNHYLNLLIVVLMCSTTLSPALMLVLHHPQHWMYFVGFLLISITISKLPHSFYDKLQLSGRTAFYKMLGVHLFKKFATNGDIINRKIRASHPEHKMVANIPGIRMKLAETYLTEQIHATLLVLCIFTGIYSFVVGANATGVLITAGNLIFNVYPILLQQYNRLRYQRVLSRADDAA
jgi:hypothetical protein